MKWQFDRVRWLAWPAALSITVWLVPNLAQAFPNKTVGTACGGCHNFTPDATQHLHVSIDGVDGATTVTVAPGGSFEVDWCFEFMRGSTTTRGTAAYVGVPDSTWTAGPTLNTNNPISVGGHTWNTAWDNATDKPGALYTTWFDNGVGDGGGDPDLPPAVGDTWRQRYDGTAWENNSGSAFDDGSANDLDGTADIHGSDARITVPASATPGAYTMWVAALGHNMSAKKTMTYGVITVTVSSGPDTTPPAVANGVRFNALPVSGDASFRLDSDWTETNPGTPQFKYRLNGAVYTALAPSDNGASNTAWKTYTVALAGDDWFDAIYSEHTDANSNGPTISEDTTTTYVLPLTPPAPGVAGATTSSLDVTVNENVSETGVGILYAIQCVTTGQYVQANGTLGVGEIYQDWASWGIGGTLTVTGLASSTTYQFAVRAANPADLSPPSGNNSTTAYGLSGSGSTTSPANTPPNTTIDPLPGTVTSSSQTITGTASDSDGTVSAVAVTIQRQDNLQYWNGTAWQAGAVEVNATNTGVNFSTWSYGWNNMGLLVGVTVNVSARAFDSIDYDPTPATASTTVSNNVAPNTTLTALPGTVTAKSYSITGTATDSDGTVSAVAVTIQRQDNLQYWNGTAWQAGAVEVNATNTGVNFSTWSYGWNNMGLLVGVTVNVSARAFDSIDYDATPATGSTTVSNNVAPDTTLDVLPATIATSSYSITGTASDSDGTVSAVLVTIQRQDNLQYWNGTVWQAGAVEVNATNTGVNFSTWSYAWNNFGSMTAVIVAVQARAFDSIDYDASPASGSTTVDNGGGVDTDAPCAPTNLQIASRTANSITLQFTVPDEDCGVPLGSAPTSYMVRYDAASITALSWANAVVFNDSYPATQPVAGTESITISGLDSNQVYYVQVKAKDEVPNISPVASLAGVGTDAGRTYLHLGWNISGVEGVLGVTNDCQTVFGVANCYAWVSAGVGDWAGGYSGTGATGVVASGKGYWLSISLSTTDLTPPGDATATAGTVSVALQSGMNLIANPHDQPVLVADLVIQKTNAPTQAYTFTDAVLAGLVAPALYAYDGTNYYAEVYNSLPAGALQPRRGYWLKLLVSDGNTYSVDLPDPTP